MVFPPPSTSGPPIAKSQANLIKKMNANAVFIRQFRRPRRQVEIDIFLNDMTEEENQGGQSLDTFSRSVQYGGRLPENRLFLSILHREYLNALERVLIMPQDPFNPMDDLELGTMAFDNAVSTLWEGGWTSYAIWNMFEYIRFSNPNSSCSCAA